MKKVLSIILASIIILSTFAIVANAAGDTISTATSINVNKSYSGSITSSSTIDYYKFTISESGRINLKMSANIQYAYFYIYDASSKQVWSNSMFWNGTTELLVLNEKIDLTSGTYYFCIKGGSGLTGSYSFSLNYTSAKESFSETQGGNNNKTSTADSINLGSTYYGQIAANDEKDFYKFTLSSSDSITLTVSASIEFAHYYIYDSSANTVWGIGKSWNGSTELLSLKHTLTLSAGTYYFAVLKSSGITNSGNYNFKITGTKTSASSIDLSLSNSSVSIKKGDSAVVKCSYTGSNSGTLTISYTIGNNSIVSCSWGGWVGKTDPLTINALKEGSTFITINIKDKATNTILDTEIINVTVTPEDSGDVPSSDGGFSILNLILSFLSALLSIFFF